MGGANRDGGEVERPIALSALSDRQPHFIFFSLFFCLCFSGSRQSSRRPDRRGMPLLLSRVHVRCKLRLEYRGIEKRGWQKSRKKEAAKKGEWNVGCGSNSRGAQSSATRPRIETLCTGLAGRWGARERSECTRSGRNKKKTIVCELRSTEEDEMRKKESGARGVRNRTERGERNEEQKAARLPSSADGERERAKQRDQRRPKLWWSAVSQARQEPKASVADAPPALLYGHISCGIMAMCWGTSRARAARRDGT